MSRDIQDLATCMQPVAIAFKARCAEAGLPIVITQTHRTDEEQQALYDQGRVRPGKIVTNARPGSSAHNPPNQFPGLAFDIAFFIPETGYLTWEEARPGAWEEVGSIGESLGLVWGGRWPRFQDKPHFEWPEWRKVVAGGDPTDGSSRSGETTG